MDGLSGLSVEGIEIEAGPVGENLAKFWRSSSRSDQLLDRWALCGRQQLLVQGSRTNYAAAIHKSGKNKRRGQVQNCWTEIIKCGSNFSA
jgi:hypothetical protein